MRLEFKRPWANGTSAVILEPLELLARLGALVPRPFANQTRFHGVLAPNAAWRHLVVPIGGRSIPRRRKERSSGGIWTSWADLLRRTYAIDVLTCPRCGGRREVIAVISNPETASGILESLGLPPEPPEIAPSWWGSAREIWN